MSIFAVSAWIPDHCKLLEPKLYVELEAGTIVLALVIEAERSPVRFPTTLPVMVSICAASAWMSDHCTKEVPKVYVEFASGFRFLAVEVVATRFPVTLPTKLPVVVSIFAVSE